MKLIAISPPDEFADEARWVWRLLDAGLDYYHLRKPTGSQKQTIALLQQLTNEQLRHVILHQHHELAQNWELAGIHYKDSAISPLVSDVTRKNMKGIRSRALHRINDLENDIRGWDSVLISPVFPSFSKPGHEPAWSEATITTKLANISQNRKSNLYALGGVDASNALRAQEMGFDGLVLHSVLWRAGDPCAAFQSLKKILL